MEKVVLECAETRGLDDVINPRLCDPLIEITFKEIKAKRETQILSPLRLFNKMIYYMVDFYSSLKFKKEQSDALCYLFINLVYYYTKMKYFEGVSVKYLLSCIVKYIAMNSK